MLLDMTELPAEVFHDDMYRERSEQFIEFERKYLIPADTFIFVIPEYNGTYPGVLKLMLDASDIKQAYHHKKAAIIGVSSGRAGNLRGMDDLTNVLNFLKINVLHLKIPISSVHKLFDTQGKFLSEEAVRLMNEQIDLLLKM